MNFISSLILPYWLHYTLNNLPAIAVSVLAGYFVASEGGFFRALKQFLILFFVGAVAVAVVAMAMEKWPSLTGQPVAQKQHYFFWKGGD